jgi:hypothetical protein
LPATDGICTHGNTHLAGGSFGDFHVALSEPLDAD